MRALGLTLLLSACLGVGCDASDAQAPARPSAPATATYPEGPYSIALGKTLPDLAFDGVREDGAPGTVHLRDYYAGQSDLLLMRVHGGSWCGSCAWYAEHTSELSRVGERLRVLDLIVGDRDNAPATAADAAEFRALLDAPDHVAVAADPAFELGALATQNDLILPLFVMVDPHTMQVVDWVSNPGPDELAQRIARAMGDEEPASEPQIDDLFSRNEWDLLHTVTLPGAPPPDPTNAVADDAAAREFGKALFFDAGLSPSNSVSCATCHDPQKHLSDGLPRGKGMQEGNRRTPDISLSAHARWQFWDGRADTLWAQALGPLESEAETGSSRLWVARRVTAVFEKQYAAAFPKSPLPDTASWPSQGKPGDAAYDALSAADRDASTRVFVNVGKAIEAYERSFRVKRTRLDDYLAGDLSVLTQDEKLGLQIFVRSGCMQCHWGPRLTDDAFHNTGAPTGRLDGKPDPGRSDGVTRFLDSEFRADSIYSDAPGVGPRKAPKQAPALLGQFKTPGLRGVADMAYFGHGGGFGALAKVTESYGRGAEPTSAGAREPWIMGFGEAAEWGLVPFLETLHADLEGQP
jgi:cytochrome c peroxidase